MGAKSSENAVIETMDVTALIKRPRHEQTDKGRVYRIKDSKASPVAADRAKQAA